MGTMADSTKHSDSSQPVATKSVSHASFCASRQQDEEDDVCTCDLLPGKIKDLFEMVYKWGRVGIVVDYNAPAFLNKLGDIMDDVIGGYEILTPQEADGKCEDMRININAYIKEGRNSLWSTQVKRYTTAVTDLLTDDTNTTTDVANAPNSGSPISRKGQT